MSSMASTTASRPQPPRTIAAQNSPKGHEASNGSPAPLTTLFDDPQLWETLKRALAKRTTSHAPSRRLGSNEPVLLWGWPVGQGDAESAALQRVADLAASEQGRQNTKSIAPAESLVRWLDQASIDTASPEAGLEALAWAHALPNLATCLEPALWQSALEKLVRTAERGAKTPAAKNLLAAQLFAAELPATLAYWFPELAVCAAVAAPAREAVLKCLETALDAEGIVHASFLPWLRPLLASWTRLAAMDEAQKRSERSPAAMSVAAQPRFPKAVAQALRLTHRDGSQALSRASLSDSAQCVRLAVTASLFRSALKFAGEPARRVAALTLPAALEPAQRAAAKEKNKSGKRPFVAFNSELSQLAVLRTSWNATDPRLTIAYANEQIRAELACGGELIASGDWTPEVQWNGELLKPISEWEEVCWVSDDDADYLELEISLTGDVRIQRHLLLARADRFLFAADAILGKKPGQIAYRSALPLAPGARFVPAKESHEGQLARRSVCGLALPLALPEWRTEPGCGELSATNNRLELRQSASDVQAMFAPLFIDLAPRRLSKPFTWRRLTVAEDRRILPNDLAVGYRVQADARQWLFYRSLGERGNRTLLGHNLVSEFLAARFNRKGIAETLLEIE